MRREAIHTSCFFISSLPLLFSLTHTGQARLNTKSFAFFSPRARLFIQKRRGGDEGGKRVETYSLPHDTSKFFKQRNDSKLTHSQLAVRSLSLAFASCRAHSHACSFFLCTTNGQFSHLILCGWLNWCCFRSCYHSLPSCRPARLSHAGKMWFAFCFYVIPVGQGLKNALLGSLAWVWVLLTRAELCSVV